jgi:7,8-dihydroneopterin aldolase/epimerase/oxygenase
MGNVAWGMWVGRSSDIGCAAIPLEERAVLNPMSSSPHPPSLLPHPTQFVDSPSRPPYVPPVSIRETITLRGMRFHTLIGALPHEREHPQPLEIDLTVWLPRRDDRSLPDILDYASLYALVSGAVGRGHITYLEQVAALIATRALAVERIERVRVAVRKPHVPLPGPLACAEVVLEQDRVD